MFLLYKKEWLKYTTQNFNLLLITMIKNKKKQSQRDGIHFSYWSKNTKKNKKSGRDSGWNFSLRIRWFTIILLWEIVQKLIQ